MMLTAQLAVRNTKTKTKTFTVNRLRRQDHDTIQPIVTFHMCNKNSSTMKH